MASSFKGQVNLDLTMKVMESGIHSGLGSGIVPDPFRITIDFIDQVQNVLNGEISF